MSSKEIAVLARGCFRGMQDLVRKLSGVTAHASATAVTFPMPPTAIAARMPRRLKQSSLGPTPLFTLLEFFFQTRDPHRLAMRVTTVA